MIHKTSIISDTAKISDNVEIGAYSFIGPEVEIGSNTIIRNNVAIEIEGNCQIELAIGDQLMITTPSGGGYGKKNKL